MTYSEAVDWIYSTQNFGIKLGLDAPAELLAQFLAYPKHDTKVIHVAGTNGKGSTCAFIDSLARSHGLKTGLFTSPHLVDFRERFRVDGEMISEELTAKYLSEIKELVEDWEHHPTFFEIVLALGMKYFREMDCELIVLETGMGGRLDATTAVPANVYVLTPIGMDHSQWLGETLEEIAGEKAGIIISDSPVISAVQDKRSSKVIAVQANRMRAPLTVVTESVGAYGVGLAGTHQRENAALALEALHQLGVEMRYDSVKDGLANVQWPGRFEVFSKDSLIVLKPIVIFGAVESKDLDGVLECLVQIAEKFIFTPIQSPRSIHYSDMKGFESMRNVDLIGVENIMEAFNVAERESMPILLTGSLYLLGEYNALDQDQEHIPTSQ